MAFETWRKLTAISSNLTLRKSSVKSTSRNKNKKKKSLTLCLRFPKHFFAEILIFFLFQPHKCVPFSQQTEILFRVIKSERMIGEAYSAPGESNKFMKRPYTFKTYSHKLKVFLIPKRHKVRHIVPVLLGALK